MYLSRNDILTLELKDRRIIVGAGSTSIEWPPVELEFIRKHFARRSNPHFAMKLTVLQPKPLHRIEDKSVLGEGKKRNIYTIHEHCK